MAEAALRDAEALVAGGVDAIMVENFGDAPFYPDAVPRETIAAVTAVSTAIRVAVDRPLGINVLRNDALGALAVAVATGACMIRVNVLAGARVTDQGLIRGDAHRLLRRRRELGAGDVAVWADLRVKHSAPLGAERPLLDELHDLVGRCGADAVIVSGAATGSAVDVGDLERVVAASSRPVYVGSGVDIDNAEALATVADGLIVGTSLKEDGDVYAPVDRGRVRRLVAAVRSASLRGRP